MAQLTKGEATWAEWTDVTNVINMAAALAGMGVGSDYKEDIRKAMHAQASCGKRLLKNGRLGYSGPELTAVNLALEVHDAQLEVATVQQIETARRIVDEAKRMKTFAVSLFEENHASRATTEDRQASVQPVGAQELRPDSQRAVGRKPEATHSQ